MRDIPKRRVDYTGKKVEGIVLDGLSGIIYFETICKGGWYDSVLSACGNYEYIGRDLYGGPDAA
jgi:hypothetical protein